MPRILREDGGTQEPCDMTSCMSEAKPAEETPVVQGPAVSGVVPKKAPAVEAGALDETVVTPPESARPDVRDPPPTGPPG